MSMWHDPIVEEIRRYREEYAAQFNYDLDAIFEDLRRKQGRDGRKVVSLPPKQAPKRYRKKGKPAA
jgi:hypothetical protein